MPIPANINRGDVLNAIKEIDIDGYDEMYESVNYKLEYDE